MSTPEATRERFVTIVTDFFSHRLSTKPEEKIVKLIKQRWAAIGELTEEEWRAMFLRYVKHQDEYRRRDLQTFLNNFSTEVSKSVASCQEKGLLKREQQEQGPSAEDLFRRATSDVIP